MSLQSIDSFSAFDKYEPIRQLQRSLQTQGDAPSIQSAPKSTADMDVANTDLHEPDDHIDSSNSSQGVSHHRDSVPVIPEGQPRPGLGTHLELMGTISEIFAQRGTIRMSSDSSVHGEGVEVASFSVWDVTYGTHRLDTKDLTNLFMLGDVVALTGRVERDGVRVLDVARIGDAAPLGLPHPIYWEEGFGTVVTVKETEGVMKSERWGHMKFSRDSLEVKNEYSSRLPVYRLLRSGMTIRYGCYAPLRGEKECRVVSVSPYGDVRRGEGRVIRARDTFAFVASEEYGEIYVPIQSLRLPTPTRIHHIREARDALFKTLKTGQEVRFHITNSLPNARCQWRAISLSIKA